MPLSSSPAQQTYPCTQHSHFRTSPPLPEARACGFSRCSGSGSCHRLCLTLHCLRVRFALDVQLLCSGSLQLLRRTTALWAQTVVRYNACQRLPMSQWSLYSRSPWHTIFWAANFHVSRCSLWCALGSASLRICRATHRSTEITSRLPTNEVTDSLDDSFLVYHNTSILYYFTIY